MSRLPRWIRGLAVLLPTLAAIYGVLRIPRPGDKPAFPEVPEKVERWSLTEGARRVDFEYVGDRWMIREPIAFPADEGAVVSALAALRNLTPEHLATRRAETHGVYRVGDGEGLWLRVWGPGDSEPRAWILGKESADGVHVFVRHPSSSEVYLASGFSRDGVEPSTAAWRDKRVLPLPAGDDIVALSAEGGRTPFLLVKTSDAWSVNGRPASSEKVQELLNALRYLATESFIDPPDAAARRPALARALRVQVRLASGATHSLRLGATEEKGRVLIEREGLATLFLVPAPSLSAKRFTADDYRAR